MCGLLGISELDGEPTDGSASPRVEEPASDSTPESDWDKEPPKQRNGHGRNGADAYHGANQVAVPHPSLEAGDDCPECLQGTLYEMPSRVLVRLVGQAPVQGTVYRFQKLRRHLCGKIFTAPLLMREILLFGYWLSRMP